MGEIGVQRRTFLYHLRLWEIKNIIKGYRKREHSLWEATRFQTYALLCAMGAKLHRPQDVIEFPWERDAYSGDLPTDDEIEEMRQLMQEMNAEMQRKREAEQQAQPADTGNSEETREAQ